MDSAHRAIVEGSLNGTIECVFCTRERGEAEGSDEFLDQAEGFGLRTTSLSYRSFKKRYSTDSSWRRYYDEAILALINRFRVDALVFAGLLLVVGNDIVEEIPSLNLHPAAPNGPVGTWSEVIGTLIRENATESGVSVQLATPELDKGPVIAFSRFPVQGPDYMSLRQASIDRWARFFAQTKESVPQDSGASSEKTLLDSFWLGFLSGLKGKLDLESDPLVAKIRQEGLRREALTLVAALRQIADGNVILADGEVRSADGSPLSGGLDITDEIEGLLAEQSVANLS